jgi:hypothetical protein
MAFTVQNMLSLRATFLEEKRLSTSSVAYFIPKNIDISVIQGSILGPTFASTVHKGLSFLQETFIPTHLLTKFTIFLCPEKEIRVRYHCGGWPEEVNSCVLNSYMVYL